MHCLLRCVFPSVLIAFSAASLAQDERPVRALRSTGPVEPAAPLRVPAETKLPPLPEGVAALAFADFFKVPVGPRGLEVTEKLRALDGQRVRILGHMVREETDEHGDDGHRDPAAPVASVPGRMLLAARPQIVNTAHYGLCEDLPPQTLFVTVPQGHESGLVFTRRLLLLTGKLSVGAHTEPDGRTSIVRLLLDPPAATETTPGSALIFGPPDTSRPVKTENHQHSSHP